MDDTFAELVNPQDVRIKSFSMFTSFDQEQGCMMIVAKHGEVALAKVLRVYCAIASQQTMLPYCRWNVGNDIGWATLAKRCDFPSAEECREFVSDMADYGLVSKEHLTEFGEVAVESISADWAKLHQTVSKAAKASAEAARKRQERKQK